MKAKDVAKYQENVLEDSCSPPPQKRSGKRKPREDSDESEPRSPDDPPLASKRFKDDIGSSGSTKAKPDASSSHSQLPPKMRPKPKPSSEASSSKPSKPKSIKPSSNQKPTASTSAPPPKPTVTGNKTKNTPSDHSRSKSKRPVKKPIKKPVKKQPEESSEDVGEDSGAESDASHTSQPVERQVTYQNATPLSENRIHFLAKQYTLVISAYLSPEVWNDLENWKSFPDPEDDDAPLGIEEDPDATESFDDRVRIRKEATTFHYFLTSNEVDEWQGLRAQRFREHVSSP
jgi:hypothetical protein